MTRGLFGDDKVKLDWRAPRILMPKNKVKLILNMCLIAAGTIPRGGVIDGDATGSGERAARSGRGKGTTSAHRARRRAACSPARPKTARSTPTPSSPTTPVSSPAQVG